MKTYRKRFEEMEKQNKIDGRVKFVEGILLGAAVGVVIGLMEAPDSGKKTMNRVKEKAQDLCDTCMTLFPCCGEGCCCEDDFEDDFEDAFEDIEGEDADFPGDLSQEEGLDA